MSDREGDAGMGEPTANSDSRTGQISRRNFVAGGAATALTAGLAGCGGVLGSGGNGNTNTVTMLLTPGTPADARRRYKPVQNLLNAEIDGAEFEMTVPTDYSAILPAL